MTVVTKKILAREQTTRVVDYISNRFRKSGIFRYCSEEGWDFFKSRKPEEVNNRLFKNALLWGILFLFFSN